MKNSINPRGYYIATLCVNGKPRAFSLHKLIALQFVSNDDPRNKTQVNHIDGNKLNNKVENLEWVTPKENMRRATKLGIFNPRLNTVYLLDMFKVSADTIKTVEKEVICY